MAGINEKDIWLDSEYVIAQKHNQTFEISPEFGFKIINFDESSPTIDPYNEENEGMDRVEFTGNRLKRPISCEFLIHDEDARNILRKVHRFFSKGEPIYIRYSLNIDFRYVCQVQSIAHEKLNNKITKIKIDFLCQNPTKESVKVFEFEYPTKVRRFDGTWRFDGTYKFDADIKIPFYFDGDSDVDLDPRAYFLELEFEGSSKDLIITNETTGDTFKHFGKTTLGDKLLITSSKTLLNGVSILRETNKALISFVVGENAIKVSNFSGLFKLTIRFRKQHF